MADSKPVDRWLGLVGAAVGIVLYLLPKTPSVVIICLLAIFACLAHPIWSFWWIEKRLWRRVAALIILAIALVLVGVAAWPPPETAAVQSASLQTAATEWLAPVANYVFELPWRWILLGFAAGALTVLTIPSIRRRLRANLLCPDKRVHEIAENDKASIKKLVRVVGILYQPDFGKAYIDFVFSVFNNSLHNIVIDNTIKKGSIRFGEDNEKFYYEPKIEGDKPTYCGSRRGSSFILRQAIRAEDIPRLRDAEDLLLYFHDLEIMFQGAAESTGIGPTRLGTNHHLQTKRRMWRDWDRLDYLFGYTDEQWAAIASNDKAIESSSARILELEGKIDELTRHHLTFEIDAKQTQVRMSGGTGGRRIEAHVKLRCLKAVERALAVREIHASLHKQNQSGEETVLPKEDALVTLDHPSMGNVDFTNGWIINEPITPYRWFMFYLDLSAEVVGRLSHEYFLRVTMYEGARREPFTADFFVNDWQSARQSNSSITLK